MKTRVVWRSVLGLAFGAAVIAVATPAVAGNRCLAKKYKIAGAAAFARARCAAAAADDAAIDPSCLAKVDARLAARWAAAEARGECLTTGDADAATTAIADFTDALEIFLEPPPARCCTLGPSTCLYVPGASECAELFGTLGAVIDRCDATTGSCLPQQSGVGLCCQLGPPAACLAGPGLSNCSDVGGTLVFGATCLPSGSCSVP